jgi:hypothetical protein
MRNYPRPSHLEFGPVRIEQITPRLLRVTAGTHQAVVAALRRAGGQPDGRGVSGLVGARAASAVAAAPVGQGGGSLLRV